MQTVIPFQWKSEKPTTKANQLSHSQNKKKTPLIPSTKESIQNLPSQNPNSKKKKKTPFFFPFTTPRPFLKSHTLSRGYGAILPTSLTYIMP